MSVIKDLLRAATYSVIIWIAFWAILLTTI